MKRPINLNEHKGEFFRVLETAERSQVAAMTIGPGSDSGAYGVHEGNQVIYIIEGEGVLEVGGDSPASGEHQMKKGDFYIISPKTRHKMYNRSGEDLFFFNVYTPPEY